MGIVLHMVEVGVAMTVALVELAEFVVHFKSLRGSSLKLG